MAISIDWGNKVIQVPKEDLTLIQSVPTEIRQLDLNAFRLELKALEDSTDGMAFERTHNHNTTVTVGGVTLARVIEMINDYTITFEDGLYAVNLVGANSNVGDVVNVNFVSIRSANSAGLQDLSTLLAASYSGKIIIDPINGQAGTSTPIGTHAAPVNNVRDALIIAKANGIVDLFFTSSSNITEDLTGGYRLVGDSAHTVISCAPEADLTTVHMEHISITGELDGLNGLIKCSIHNVTGMSGFASKCILNATIGMINDLILLGCSSNVIGDGYPIMDVSSGNLAVRDFHGSLGLINVTGGTHSVEVYGGRLFIDPSCVGGTIHVRGEPFEVVDNSSAGCTIIHQVSNDDAKTAQSVWEHTI